MVHFVGAGPGAADLITLRGKRLLEQADVIVYAGSLVNPALLEDAKEGCTIYNSACMTLEEVVAVMEQAEREGKDTVRLHTGDPSIYGAIREQMDLLEQKGIPYDNVPGVSSFCGAAAALHAEYTLPSVSQTLILTRLTGRTPVPAKEEMASLASHGASMAVFLSAGMTEELSKQLQQGGYPPDTPAAIVYKATWPDEKVIVTTIADLPSAAKKEGIEKTALILVGGFLKGEYDRSRLYDPQFTHAFRQGKGES